VAHLFSAHARTPAHRPWADDVGLIVVSTLTKVLLVLAVVAAVGYDSVAMSIAAVSIRDQAQAAAQAAHEVLHNTQDQRAALVAAQAYAVEHGDQLALKGFTVGQHNTVTVTLTHETPTLVARYLPRINSLVVTSGTGTATDPLR
jgi:hypothetical protein